MYRGENGNQRDGADKWVEGLFTGAGATVGRVLNQEQVRAASLTIEVFAYLLDALPAEEAPLADVIGLLKFYSKVINNAKE